MAAEFSYLLSCSIGGADFQLVDYSVNERAKLEPGKGRVETIKTVQGRGYIEASTPAAFETAIASVRTAFSRDGQWLVIRGLGGALEYDLSPATSNRGGPFIESFDFEEGGDNPGLTKFFTFTVSNDHPKDDEDDEDEENRDTWVVHTRTRPDLLLEVTYEGSVHGPSALAYFRDKRISRLRKQYPAGEWMMAHEVTTNHTERVTEYTVGFVQLANPLPVAPVGSEVVDAEATQTRELDERGRKVETRTFDLLIRGDPIEVYTKLRPVPPPEILRESYSYSSIHEQRLRLSFTLLSSAEDNDLVDWEHSLEYTGEQPQRVVFEYVGRAPEFGQKAGVYRAVQRGRAVGLKRYPLPAEPIIDDSRLLEGPPRYTHRVVNKVELETGWEYVFLSASPLKINAAVLKKLDPPREKLFLV